MSALAEGQSGLAPAAKVRNPPFVSKSAWRSNLTDSLSHNYRERPFAAFHRYFMMLRCGPSKPPFAQGAAFFTCQPACGQHRPWRQRVTHCSAR
jgi:hypothetical protein